MPSGLDDKMLTGYLLGELSEAQQTRVEEQLFSDQTCYERLQALKAEITDQYVRKTLAPAQSSAFARRFLRTEDGREDALFARAFDRALREENARQFPAAQERPPASWWRPVVMFFRTTSGWQIGMAAIIVALMIGLAWLLIERQRMIERLETAIDERDAATSGAQKLAQLEEEIGRLNSQNRELAGELQQARQALEKIERPPQTGSVLGAILSFALAPGARRGNQRVETRGIGPQVRTVQLRLLLEAGETGAGYRAEIRTKEGTLIHSQDRLRPQRTDGGNALLVMIPADRLKDGQYEVSLFAPAPAGGSEVIHYYDFGISRR